MSQVTSEIRVTLPDGSVRTVAVGTTVHEVAAAIGPGLARAAVVARVNGTLVGLATPLREDVDLALLTDRDPEALHVLRHSTAHATAQAVQELFPGTKIA
ncbi:MAG: TGS domain-containing protein, partial [Acidobacteriota bacterium]